MRQALVMTDPSPPARRKSAELRHLTGLRGLSALFVVAHHAYYGITMDRPLPSFLGHATYWLYFGRAGLDVFIVLSGYCLMIPFAREPGKQVQLKAFFARRAKRIIPTYYAAMALTLAMTVGIPALDGARRHTGLWQNSVGGTSAGSVLSHILLLHNTVGRWHDALSYPLWSVATEWQIYVVFALLLLPLRARLGSAAAAAGAAVLGLVPLVLTPSAYGVATQFLILFALGMLSCDLTFREAERWSSWRRRVPWGVLSAILLVLLGIVSLRTGASRFFVPAKDVVVGAAVSCLLVALGVRSVDPERGRAPAPVVDRVRRVLESRPLLAVGTFSYSLYLFHAPNLALGQVLTERFGLGPTASLAVVEGVVVPLTTAVCFLFYFAFERPLLTTRASLDRGPVGKADDVAVLG